MKKLILSRDSTVFMQRLVYVFDQDRKHVEVQNQRTDNPTDFTVLC